MFEDYVQDSFAFFEMGQSVGGSNERSARMFYRASVFCAASSLEAFVNFIGDSFNRAGGIDRTELAYINDKVLEINAAKGGIEERTKYNSIDGKVKFIIKRFDVPIDPLVSTTWRHFKEFKKFRDSLVHPRDLHDEVDLEAYADKIRTGLNANIDIMNSISQKLFSKPLRQSLLDLKI